MQARSSTLVILQAALLAGAAMAHPDAPPPDRALYEQGRQAIMAMRWDQAAGALGRLLAAYPDSPFADDALYWRAFALAEAGDCASAYPDLATLEERYPRSPRAAAGRSLRVRCAGSLMAASPDDPKRGDYARLISEATRADALPARLSAAEVLLSADPVEGARALRVVAADLRDRAPLEVLLDRHFGSSPAVARPADPALPLGPANAVILVRRPGGADALAIPEALRAARDQSDSAYPPRTRIRIEQALGEVRHAAVTDPAHSGREVSRVAQVDDSEIHLYRGAAETVRILVLNRRKGYREDNVRVFVEQGGRQAELGLREAEKMVESGSTRTMGPRALTFVGSSLALIRLDLDALVELGEAR